ncbi:MAG TPA: hypothetical protein P5294_03720 [Smithellaceae bacterium]|nr:hypothetical protein [Smithellaceae bacterium]HRS89004.1 hypothetical protein [Smithellaceae bacterium]HRV25620.1 hypothetical protein [Smithellaceae bacterium]
MTTVFQERSSCAICGNEKEFVKIYSTNSFGSPDLDTRPPEMMRSTMHAWVQQCPECGYCASDVVKAPPEAKKIIEDEKYKSQLKDEKYPKLANLFICMSIIEEQASNCVNAMWALIHAAWVCDDSGHSNEAKTCRNRAVEMLLHAEKHDKKWAKQQGSITAILVDLLRRSGRLEEAREAIAQRRAEISGKIIITILDFQSALIKQGDVSCYTVSQAMKNKSEKK